MLRNRKYCMLFTLLCLVTFTVVLVQMRLVAFDRDNLENTCQELGLQNITAFNYTSLSAIKCKPHRPSRVGCAQAYKYYGLPGHIEHRECNEPRHPDICSFKKTKSGNHRLLCNAEVCGSSNVTIGSVNAKMGKVTDWIPTSKETITVTVQEAVKTNQKNGFGFLYIKCGNILQSLIFQPILKKVENNSVRNNINVNIVVLDSVARPHFYRILPRSVAVLRAISQDPDIKATALDFELFQSVGQHSFDNLRPLFSGVIKDDDEISDRAKTAKEPLGVEVLFGAFRKWGYQTLFQEDLCWYDYWGIGLTDLQVRARPDGDSEFKDRYLRYTPDHKFREKGTNIMKYLEK